MIVWFLIALVSAFLSAFSAITQKKVLFNISALEFSFVLSVVNLLLSIPMFFFIDYNTVSSLSLEILFVKSIIGVLAFLCVMLTLKNLQISNALPLLALTPGFVAVFAFIFIGDKITLVEAAGLALFIAGTYIIESKNNKDLLSTFQVFIKSKSHHYILMALMLFTASSILDKLLLKKYSLPPVALIAFQHLFFAVIFYVIYIFNKKSSLTDLRKIPYKDLGLILLTSVLTIGYRYTQVLAVSMAPVALVLAIKRTSVFWASLIGGRLFKDTNLLRKGIAVTIIVIGAILILKD
ncbi:MAG: EamA family transporter [Bacillota bacterium]